jgi:hypothetical protein
MLNERKPLSEKQKNGGPLQYCKNAMLSDSSSLALQSLVHSTKKFGGIRCLHIAFRKHSSSKLRDIIETGNTE